MSRLRMLLKILIGVTALWGLLVFLAWRFQRSLIYIPPAAVPEVQSLLPGARDVQFETADGLRLSAWYLPGRGEPTGMAVVLFHGNAGSRAGMTPLADALANAGHAVLLTDYRGYAGNPGKPTEAGLLADARAAVDWLENDAEPRPSRIAYFGESLGSGVATALAVERPPAVLILRSPFTSMTDVAAGHYPFLPVRPLLKDRYPNLDRIGSIACPLLIVAGDRDAIVPEAQSRRLYDAAAEPKQYLLIEGADHNDYAMIGGEDLLDAVLGLLAAHRAPGDPGAR
ncbi:hypothetical protein ABI59_06820 [Acidobacteria bacterium Mor1]|nr:hypothetical protein ABI59_06820 [Acidobacteria bacterium Mor1]